MRVLCLYCNPREESFHAGISTHGRQRSHAIWVGDPPRKLVTRYLRWFVARDARVRYAALYHMNVAAEVRRERLLGRVERVMRGL